MTGGEPAMTGQLPLSPGQQRMWFLHRLRPADPAYNIVTAVELTGPVAPAALAAATGGLLAGHPVLRARFALAGGRPVQLRPAATGPARPRLVDLTGLAAGCREPALDRLLRAAAARPFDLGTGPVAEWSLLRLAADRHVLVFAVHHIVFDGGSLWVACREIEQRYAGSDAGRPARPAVPGTAPAVPPGDAAADLAYWRRRLAGAPARLRVLPAGAGGLDPAPAPDRPAASEVTIQLGTELAGQVKGFAGRSRSTPFMVLLAAFGGLLVRYTGQPDLVVGTPVSSRETDQSWSAIGLFLNLLPLRLELGGDPSLRAALERVRGEVLDAFAHRAVPFEQLVDELRPPRELGSPPLVQVVFAHQHSPAPPRLPGLGSRLLPVAAAAAKYDLTVIVTDPGAGELDLTVQAAPTADPDAPQLFAANFQLLLAGALHDPECPLSRLPLLAPVPAGPTAAAGPAPAEAAPEPGRPPPVPPRTARERAVATVWCGVLGRSEVDVHQSFFDLGGSSLSLLDLHARLCAEVAGGLTLADLFRFPTVASLAAFLDRDRDAATGSLAGAAARGARRRAAAAGPRRGAS